MTSLTVTTVRGLEDVLADELCEVLGSGRVEYERGTGRVYVWSDDPVVDARLVILRSRIAEKVYLTVGEYSLRDMLEKAGVIGCDVVRLFNVHTFFAVRVKKREELDVESPEIARRVGAGIVEAGRKVGLDPRVSLDDPDVLLVCDVGFGKALLCIDLIPGVSLHERPYRRYIHPSMLNPVVAAAMVRLAHVGPGDRVLDPVCGSGTLLIECKLFQPDAEVVGVDVCREHIRGAVENSRTAGVLGDWFVADIGVTASCLDKEFDVVLANPPYGIRERARGGLVRVYNCLFRLMAGVLRKGGRACIITPRRGLVARSLEKTRSLRVSSVRRVVLGDLNAYIYTLTKC